MEILNNIDWPKVVTAVISFGIGLIIKTLLDFNLAKIIVKKLYWLPVRYIFRQKPTDISGNWEQIWDFSETENFSKETERHSHTIIKQFGNYCYCEFYSRDEKYYIFGVISGNYINGTWGDLKDKLGYYGSFQFQIINSKKMEGKWVGHSKSKQKIFCDDWKWNKKD